MNSEKLNSVTPVLAIETSSSICGACVYFSREKYFQSYINYKNVHAEKLLETIDSVMKSAELKPGDLGAIAVSNGPGSFTGLRIGMSAAKGIAFGSSLPIIQVPTFEALAFQISRYLSENEYFNIANKANTDEVYYAKFQIKGNNYIFVENLKILRFEEFLGNSKDIITFGNAVKSVNKNSIYRTDIFAPFPEFVAEWAVKFGKDRLMKNIDFTEPNYLKNFTIKVRRK